MKLKQRRQCAFGYVRVSTDEQVQEGVSLKLQEESIRAYAKIHNYEVVEIIRDEGISARNLKRPGFQHLLEIIENGRIDAIIIYRLDRLTRSTRDLLWLIDEVFEKSDITLLSLSENIDTRSAIGKYFLTNLGALAQMERELISERIRGALAYKKHKGEPLGREPFGFRHIDNERVPVAEEIAVVRLIKKWRRRGYSYQIIANKLNDLDLEERIREKWYAGSVQYIHKNRLYRRLPKLKK